MRGERQQFIQDYTFHKSGRGCRVPLKPPCIPQPKPRWLPQGKRMTLITGMKCKDCMFFSADREETTEYGGKRSVSKIHDAQGTGWAMAIATAGSAVVGDIAALRIITMARGQQNFADDPEPLLREALTGIYGQYIFPRDERRQGERGISLIVGIQRDDGTSLLFKTYEDMVKTEGTYACAGAGQEIAYYFLDRLYEERLLAGDEAQVLMAFILREAKSSVGGVGRESEFLQLFHSHGQKAGITSKTLVGQAIDWREIPTLSDCLKPFWWQIKPSTSGTSKLEP